MNAFTLWGYSKEKRVLFTKKRVELGYLEKFCMRETYVKDLCQPKIFFDTRKGGRNGLIHAVLEQILGGRDT